MPSGLQLGVHQLAVPMDFKSASMRGDQGQGFDVVLKFLEQFARQTEGLGGVVSSGAVGNFHRWHVVFLQD